MIPSIGRIVIFTQGKDKAPVNGTRQHPAVITRVFPGGVVNLHVFYDGGMPSPETSVCEAGRETEQGEDRTWHWPPRVAS